MTAVDRVFVNRRRADGKQSRKLRNYFIDRKYQTKFLATALCSGFCLSMLFLWTLYCFFSASGKMDAGTLKELLLLFGSLCFLLTMAFTTLALVLSHRGAGAVYHIRRVLQEARNGRRDARIVLRRGDDFQELASEINALLDEAFGDSADLKREEPSLRSPE